MPHCNRTLFRLAASTVTLAACVAVDHPSLRACASNGGGGIAGSAGGRLRIVPSLVPGVELQKASWNTYARTMDLGATEGVEYHVTLRSTRDVPDTDVAVVYEQRTETGVTSQLLDSYLRVDNTSEIDEDPRLHQKDLPRVIIFTVEGNSGIGTGLLSSSTSCPVAVRVVPRNLLALYVQAGLSLAEQPEARIARIRGSRAAPDTATVHVLSTMHYSGDNDDLYGMVVENTADTAVRNMVVALGVQVGSQIDTLEFVFRTVAPRGTAGMTKSGRSSSNIISTRLYHAARVIDPTFAVVDTSHEVSGAPKVAEVEIVGIGTRVSAEQGVPLWAVPLDGTARPAHEFDRLPVRWKVTSTGSRVLIDTSKKFTDPSLPLSVRRQTMLSASHAAIARVTATIGGVSVSGEVTFLEPKSPPTVKIAQMQGRHVLADGTIEIMNLCRIRPDGSVKYADWLAAHIATVRAESLDTSELAAKQREGLKGILADCK